jgi:hypothetical protein
MLHKKIGKLQRVSLRDVWPHEALDLLVSLGFRHLVS